MNYVKLDGFVELSQGLCVNQKTATLFSETQNDNFIYPLLKIANMQENNFDIYVSKDVNKKVIANQDDLIYTRTGLVGYCFRGFNGVVHNNSFIVNITKPAELDKDYLFIILNTDFVKSQAIKMARTSVQPDLTHDMFKSLLIPLPNIKIQKMIVNIILNIDNQIKRNNEMVQKLQDLASSTYSRWFNQFEFPNEEGLPYKTNSGKFVYSEELKRNIPIGWEVKELGDLLVKNTKKYNGTSIETIDLSVMPSNSFGLMNLNNSDNFTTNLFEMQKGDILFGSIRPYLKKAGIAPCNGAYAGTVYSYTPINTNDYNICLSALTNEQIFSFAVKNAKGTKMPVIANDDLMEYKIPYNKSIAKLFNDMINIKDIVCNCIMQNIELNNLKSKLLPLLINGQLEV